MMQSKPVPSLDALDALKRLSIQQASAPLDGMWLNGFVPLATHYGLYDGDELGGFYCVNDDGYLLQFFVDAAHEDEAGALFASITSAPAGGALQGAFVSTAESRFLSLCLDRFASFRVNALMYQLAARAERAPGLALEALDAAQLDEAVAFAVAAIGAPEGWLAGYYAGLIERGELFGWWDGGRLVATGECRGPGPYQPEHVDLGVVVAESERGKGLATGVLRGLVRASLERGLKPICSTEAGNLAAQKAIRRAGFVAEHRIVQFSV